MYTQYTLTHSHTQIFTLTHLHTHNSQLFTPPYSYSDKCTCSHTHIQTFAQRHTLSHKHQYTVGHIHTPSHTNTHSYNALTHYCSHTHLHITHSHMYISYTITYNTCIIICLASYTWSHTSTSFHCPTATQSWAHTFLPSCALTRSHTYSQMQTLSHRDTDMQT